MALVWCIFLAMNGYFAWANWPDPLSFISIAFAVYSAYNLYSLAVASRVKNS